MAAPANRPQSKLRQTHSRADNRQRTHAAIAYAAFWLNRAHDSYRLLSAPNTTRLRGKMERPGFGTQALWPALCARMLG